MPWINPLDRVPQVPQDWANHIVYGGFLGLLLLMLFEYHRISPWPSADALGSVFIVAAVKKIFDFYKGDQSLAVCVGKTLVTCLWPCSVWLVLL